MIGTTFKFYSYFIISMWGQYQDAFHPIRDQLQAFM